MEKRYLLLLRARHLDGSIYSSVLSTSDDEESLNRYIYNIFLDYYKKSNFYIKDTLDKKMYGVWLSHTLGVMKKEEEYDDIQETSGMQYQDGSGCVVEAIGDSETNQ